MIPAHNGTSWDGNRRSLVQGAINSAFLRIVMGMERMGKALLVRKNYDIQS